MSKTQCKVTREAAEFIINLTYDDIPTEAVEIAKRCIIDGLGVIFSGSSESTALTAGKYARLVGGVGESSVLGKNGFKAPAHLAAFVNGMAGHALDWDDTALSREADRSVLIHPTMPPLCACLAMGEVLGSSGKAFITAFVAGVELECKLAESIHPDHFTGVRGFHTSGTMGTFGAAAAAVKLMGLSLDQVLCALGVAAGITAGIGVNHGTMGKPLTMGRAAENGVAAARMASVGMTARDYAFEGPRGFFQAFGGGWLPERICGKWGNPYSILDPGISIKPYPSGVVGHPGMDAMRALVVEHDIHPEQVESITVATGPSVIPPKGPLRFSKAQTALEGKFCLQFQVAAMVINRRAGLLEFSDAFVQRPDVQDMMDRVTTLVDPEIAVLGHDKLIFKTTVVTKDGKAFDNYWDAPYRGGPLNPLTTEDLVDKFKDASQMALGESVQDEIINTVSTLENLTDVTDLVAMSRQE